MTDQGRSETGEVRLPSAHPTASPSPLPPLELWVGPEASYVRIHDQVSDQLALSSFAGRPDDLDRLASLGATRIRFPLLWERTWIGGQQKDSLDWTWADAALHRLKRLELRPVLGLVHHGGGPLPGGVLDPGFAEGLATYAGAVARRSPWIDAYTPVNEPLTTARFSALYGHWHPHASSDQAFVQALLNQLRGTVLSMQAIREVNPAAALIQTEDMGRVYGTPALQEQVDFENLRRWLSFDLLCGRVDEQHGLWRYLRWAGAAAADILWFAQHPCPPGVLGLNVYPTSERFLDDRQGRYPPHLIGGNGRQRYADVEAVRVRGELPGTFFERLMEAHRRYHLPLAITEAHLGCTREEQLRWLHAAWRGAQQAREAGAEVLAVTAWSAFGSFDWNSLLTRFQGHYESGLWDVGGTAVGDQPPRETALVNLARELAAGKRPSSPVLNGPGWWQRALRRHLPDDSPLAELPVTGPALELGPGNFRAELEDICFRRGLPTSRLVASSAHALNRVRPWARIEAAGPGGLHLSTLNGTTLEVQAPQLSAAVLGAALDLLIDAEAGLWVWNGQRFASMKGHRSSLYPVSRVTSELT